MPLVAAGDGSLSAGLISAVSTDPAEVEGEAYQERTMQPAAKEWRWRRVTVAEFAIIAAAGVGTLYSESTYDSKDKAGWTGHNGFDEATRKALRLHSGQAPDAAGSVGDGLMALLIAEPIFDSFYTLGYRDRRWDALWQTSVINLESLTFTSLVSSVLQISIKREKPFQRICPDGSCSHEQINRGMPSGHVAFAFTGAGLYCTHHKYQSLYDPATEKAICVTSLGLAAVDGVLRVMADRHYATDVLAGSAIGLFSGFLLPRLLHYYWSDREPEKKPTGKRETSFISRLSLSPQILSGGGGLSCDISF